MEEVVHYYNVITGKCVCGAAPERAEKAFSVFPEKVSCPQCLRAIGSGTQNTEKSEGKSGR